MLVPREAAVEHRGAGETAAPGVRVAKVAPGVVEKLLFDVPLVVGDNGPRAQVVDEGEKRDARQAVHVVVGECLSHARPLVISGG